MSLKTNEKTEHSIMLDMLLVLLVLSGISFYYYGMRALIIILISVTVCCLTDFICIIARKAKFSIKDISSVITGLVLALMMPASIPYRIVVIAAIFSIIIGKQVFGGHGCEIFNCAAVGFLFVSLCFSGSVLMYPKPFDTLALSSSVSNVLKESLSKTIFISAVPDISFIDILLGKFCGPMGATHIIVLLVAAIFLICRRSVSAIVFFTEMVSVLAFSFFYNCMSLELTQYTLGGGMLLFGVLFLSCDHSTVPKTRSSRFLYGLTVGLLIILFQYLGKTDTAVIFAVIIATPFGIELDRRALSFAEMIKKNSGLHVTARKVFNKPLNYINETISLLERDDNTDGKQVNKSRKSKSPAKKKNK